MQNGPVTFEDSLMVSYKAKHSLRYDPAIALLGIYPFTYGRTPWFLPVFGNYELL